MVRIEGVTEDFLTDKGKVQGGKSGNYRSDANRELDRFTEFVFQHEDAVITFEELESGHLREYARHLTRQGWAMGTVRTYYAYVSAFCGGAVREGHLAENVAQRRNATEPISGGKMGAKSMTSVTFYVSNSLFWAVVLFITSITHLSGPTLFFVDFVSHDERTSGSYHSRLSPYQSMKRSTPLRMSSVGS